MKLDIKTVFAAFLFLVPLLAQGQGMRYKMVVCGQGEWTDPKREENVHKLIDTVVEDGYNVISTGSFYFMPQYFVDFAASPYPEAAVYTSEKIAQNVEVFRSNIRYAKEKGIEFFITRSNSHYVPYPYWLAHQDELNPGGMYTPLLEVAHQFDMFQKAKEGKSPNCVPHQQWTNPCFRDFFLWSTREVLRVIPELDGFLNAYAEAAWTFDEEKVASGKWKRWRDCVDYEKTDSCFAAYLNDLYKMLHEERGDDCLLGIRDWYVKPQTLASLDMPKDSLILSVKYAGYDQPLVNFPPWAMDLHEMGLGVSLDIHVFDAEYPSPVYWYNNRVVNEMCSNLIEAGFQGITNQDYIIRGSDSADNPIRRLTQVTFASAIEGKPFSDAQALDFLAKEYKKAAPNVLASLKAVSDANENLIKIMPAWFWRGDGLSVGGTQPFNFWFFFDNPEAPDRMGFVRQDVVGIPEYVSAVLDGGKSGKELAGIYHSQGRLTPDDVIRILDEESQKAVDEILKARKLNPKAPKMQDLVASAYINRALSLRNLNFVKAAKLYYLSGYVYNGKFERETSKVRETGLDYRDEVIACLNEYIQQDLLMRRIMKDFAPRRRTLRHANTYDHESKVAATMKREVDKEDRTAQEYDRIKTIITGK
ncbi:MAG: hypothetical protein ACI395_02700 [Candidatus Cryptobacteroides sp.]